MIDRRALLGGGATALGGLASARLVARRYDALAIAYVNGRVWTGDRRRPTTNAIGVFGDRIAALGNEVRPRIGAATRVVDLKGAFVVPSLIDAHVHFLMGAFGLTQVQLRDAASPAALAERLGAYARRLRPGEWILGGSWDHERWGGRLPTASEIDAATADNPVAVSRLDGHMYLLNSVALRLAGIDRNTPDPPGGAIERNPAGEPTGVVKDAGKALVDRVVPPPPFEREDEALRVGIDHALARGVTQVHNMGLTWQEHDAFRRARRRGETDLRFYSFVPLKDHARLARLVRAEGRGDTWVRWGGLKGYADGSLGSGTALFRDAYSDDPHTHGLEVTPARDLEEWITAGDAARLHVAIHAIGDRANDELLDIFQRIAARGPRRDRRFRIEHAQHLSASAIGRFAKLGVIPSMQPSHLADDGRWAARRLGAQRLGGTYAFGSLLASRARLAFGSDWPIVEIDPLAAISAAVTRQTIDGANPGGWIPQQKIGVEPALRAFTQGGAFAGFQEKEVGTIALGFLADFVVLSDSPFEVHPDRIAKIEVQATVVGGRQRFAR